MTNKNSFKRNILVLGTATIAAITAIFIGLTYTTPELETDRNEPQNDNSLTRGNSKQSVSLFDSDILGNNGQEIKITIPDQSLDADSEPEILEPTAKDNPINAETGLPYNNSATLFFNRLRKKFPHNALIPHKKSPEELRLDQANNKLSTSVTMQTTMGQDVSDENKNKYNRLRLKKFEDRIQLSGFLLNESDIELSDETRTNLNKLLEHDIKSVSRIETILPETTVDHDSQ